MATSCARDWMDTGFDVKVEKTKVSTDVFCNISSLFTCKDLFLICCIDVYRRLLTTNYTLYPLLYQPPHKS